MLRLSRVAIKHEYTRDKESYVLSIGQQASRLPISGNLIAVLSVVKALADAADTVSSKLVSDDPWEFREGVALNPSGDVQTEQDEFTHKVFEAALKNCPVVGHLVSEEVDGIISLGPGNLSVSLDPFDGSKAYEFGIPPGTIFGIFDGGDDPSNFSGDRILAAGVFIYRHSLELILTVGMQTYRITANSTHPLHEITSCRALICANLSNISNWSDGWRDYFSSRILYQRHSGKYNTRWYGSLAAHFGALIRTGGIFAYPPDSRPGYSQGHLRLIYEAIPISYIIEALGGKATNGVTSILSMVPSDFHQKTALAFGEKSMILELESSIQRDQL